MRAFVPIQTEELTGRRRPGRGARWLGAAISLVSLGAVVWWISRQGAPQLPDSPAGFAWLALALVVIAANFGLRGLRWHLILRAAAIPHRTRDAHGLLLVGYMGNTVLPARGGELLRIALLGQRTDAKRRAILGTVLVERALDGAVLVALGLLLALAGAKATPDGLAPALGGGVAVLVLLAAGAWAFRLRRRGRLERLVQAVRPVVDTLRAFAGRAALWPAALTALIWSIDGFTLMLLTRSIDVELGFGSALAVVVLAALAAALPAAPGYAGTFDAAMLVGLHAAGLDGTDASGVLLLTRFAFFVPVTIAGLVTLVAGYGGVRRAARLADEPLTPAAG
jgi:uncharacterized membrane protein YbhN (UPF0104 family)